MIHEPSVEMKRQLFITQCNLFDEAAHLMRIPIEAQQDQVIATFREHLFHLFAVSLPFFERKKIIKVYFYVYRKLWRRLRSFGVSRSTRKCLKPATRIGAVTAKITKVSDSTRPEIRRKTFVLFPPECLPLIWCFRSLKTKLTASPRWRSKTHTESATTITPAPSPRPRSRSLRFEPFEWSLKSF